MPSTFEGVIKRVVQELDHGGKLIPVDSLRSSASFQPYCLLSRKLPSSGFFKPGYKCTNLSIRDILEPDAPEPDVKQSAPIYVYDSTDGEVQGSGELEAAGQGRLTGKAAVSSNFKVSMNVCTRQVDPNVWDAMKQERRLRRPEHKVLRQLRDCGNDVFVVTEVLQTQEEVTVTQTHKHEGSGQFALLGALSLQGHGEGHRSRKKTVTIPSGSVLAFQVAQLLIDPDWGERGMSSSTGTRSTRRRGPSRCPSKAPGLEAAPAACCSDASNCSQTALQRPLRQPGKTSRACRQRWGPRRRSCGACPWNCAGGYWQACWGCCGKRQPYKPWRMSWNGACAARGRPPWAAQWAPSSSAWCTAPESWRRSWLSPSSTWWKRWPSPAVLSEAQRAWLAKMPETGGLSGQLELVGSVLTQSSPWRQRKDVSLLPRLLGSSWGPEAPAWVLLEECGLEVRADAPQVCWEPEAQGRTCALYACLVLLWGLSRGCS